MTNDTDDTEGPGFNEPCEGKDNGPAGPADAGAGRSGSEDANNADRAQGKTNGAGHSDHVSGADGTNGKAEEADKEAFDAADGADDDAGDAGDDVPGEDSSEKENSADASAKSNGKEESTSPFGDTYAEGTWRDDLPSVAQAKAIPLSVVTPPALRALGRLYAEDVSECWGLIRQLVAAAKDPAVTEAKMHKLVEKAARQWRKERRETDVGPGNEGRETAADIMVRLSRNGTELFHTADGIAFVTVTQPDGCRSTMRLKSRTFATEMLARYFSATNRGATADTLNTAVLNLEAAAVHSGPVHQIYPRVGWHNGRIYVDRGTERGDAYEIEPARRLADGSFKPSWRLAVQPPVRFIRPEGVPIGVLPEAVSGSSLDELHVFLRTANAGDMLDDSFVIAVAWVLGCYFPYGERVHMVPVGPPGSGKTTQTRFYCALADPLPLSPENSADDPGDPGGEPEDPWSIMLAAKSSLIQTMDNVSKLTDDLHNVLCRLATGTLYRRRAYYTLTEETAIAAKRPAIFTAVKDVVERDDLAERCVFRPTQKMNDEERSTLRDLWAAFVEKWPGILGCIFDAVSVGLGNADLPKPARQPRMADFAHWVARCEPGLGWPAGTIYAVLERNRLVGAESIVDADPVAASVRDFMAAPPAEEVVPLSPYHDDDSWTGWTTAGWAGSHTELLEALGKLTTPEVRRSNKWPKMAHILSRDLAGVQVALQRLGVAVEASRTSPLRRIALRWVAPHPRTPSETFPGGDQKVRQSASSASSEQQSGGDGSRCNDAGDADDACSVENWGDEEKSCGSPSTPRPSEQAGNGQQKHNEKTSRKRGLL